MIMDWFNWLSKTELDPSLVYEYGLTFSHNELEEDDIKHFDHPFLLSIGVSVAKHRLLILNLANNNKKKKQRRLFQSLLVRLVDVMRGLVRRRRPDEEEEEDQRRSLVVVEERRRPSYGWRVSALKRDQRKLVLLGEGRRRLMITDGRVGIGDGPAKEEEIRWDCMFGDLKPT
ncbi:hypothetical protein QJS10_CPA02g01176 [Acorus calamus]|uniref:SAM domain-containing protein n=1 Tax=Acorus calamus TaxID=4465 RepID=A0AAV9FC18_ACOCL|nr:hypothetical protein QJS10_CPA02g01176 [Acorus calamus]